MKVRDLIEKLKEFNEDAQVTVEYVSEDWEVHTVIDVEKSSIQERPTADLVVCSGYWEDK